MKRKIENLSKAIFSSFVIFQMVFATAATPVVAFAFEDEIKEAQVEFAEKQEEVKDVKEEIKVEEETQKEESSETKDEEVASDEEQVSTEEENTSDETDQEANETQDEEVASDEETVLESEDQNTSDGEGSASDESSETKEESLEVVNKVTNDVCIPGNLIANGGFESPVVAGSWQAVPNGTPNMEWNVDWADNYAGAPLPANMEIQTSNLWTPYEGNQYVELDSDWGYNNGEEAGTRISQEINTVPGVEYTLSFAFSARPGTNIDENGVQIILDDVDYGNPWFRDGSGRTDTDWTIVSVQFTAVKSTTVVSLEYAYDDTNGWNGSPDSFGTLIDDVSVNCEGNTTPTDPTGSITVCKLIVNGGVITDGSENPGSLFSIAGVSKPAHLGSSFNQAGVIGNSTFETALNLNTSMFDPDKRTNDVECVTYDDLDYGNYFYAEEVVPAGWATPKYNDGVNGLPTSINDFYAYSNELFTDDGGADDNARNTKSDGHIVLSANNPNRVLVVKNEYEGQNGPSCDSQEIWARVVVTSYSNEGNGNLTDTIYLGSDSNTVASGEWFNTSELDADSIQNYADVPGIAVQRKTSGEIVLELHGSQTSDDLEYLDGYIEFFNGTPTVLTGAVGQDKLEDETYLRPDSVWIDGDKAYFDLQVNTADDRFTTQFVYSLDETCDNGNGGGDDANLTWGTTFNEAAANDGSIDNTVTVTITDGNFINPGFPGTTTMVEGVHYNISNVPAGLIAGLEINADGTEVTITLSGNAINNDDADDISDLTIEFLDAAFNGLNASDVNNSTKSDLIVDFFDNTDNNGGGGSSSSSSSGSRISRPGGEVLGAQVGPSCIRFTQYYDLGDRGGEISALQTFLNDYMNANLSVDGVYGRATAQAVHNLQALHWDEIIDPWTPPLSPNTTGRFYKSTRAAVNAILGCPEEVVFLEDPATNYTITEVSNMREYSKDATIAALGALNSFASAN